MSALTAQTACGPAATCTRCSPCHMTPPRILLLSACDTEFEALLKVFLADHGDKRALLANLRAVRAWAADEHRQGVELVRDYLETGGPFPDRLHIIALMVGFLGVEWGAAVHRWATWAEHEVLRWPQVRHVEPNRQVLEDYLRLAERQLEATEAPSAPGRR
jgi:hypothetical protein